MANQEWDRISKALFGAVPLQPSPGFKQRVLANLEEPRPVPLKWLAPAFAAALMAMGMIVSPADEAPTDEVELVLEVE